MTHRVTIADVAREAGVSPQTVSRALNGKGEISESTRQLVLGVMERLAYRPSGIARGLATHKTYTLGLVVPDIANPFFAEVARGAEDSAHAAGYCLLLCNTAEDPAREAEALLTLEERRVDGVLLCGSRLAEDKLADLAKDLPAIVLLNRKSDHPSLAYVCVDDAQGSLSAVRHLLSSGRRAIGYLAGPPSSYSGQVRAKGYAAALAEFGIALDPDLIRHCTPCLEGGQEAAHNLILARPDVDALFCYNDLVAIGALQACSALARRVPDDVALVGCDDILLAGLIAPALTTLRVPQRELGATAMQVLLARISGGEAAGESVVQPHLIVRASAPYAEQEKR